jgi:hypothetical protein
MRFIWFPFCFILVAVAHVQADSYRDRDDGFNPLNVMQGMPSPMGMFNSSDRDDRPRRPPPPPRMAPRYPYPAPSAYGVPPVPRAPYHAAPHTQSTWQPVPQRSPQPPSQTNVSRPPEPAPSAPYQEVPSPTLDRQSPSPRSSQPSAQPAYSFRPMTPPEPPAAEAPTTAGQPVTGDAQPAPPAQYRRAPASGQTVLTAPYPEQETPMVNGQPAIFRPMDLGVDNPSPQ